METATQRLDDQQSIEWVTVESRQGRKAENILQLNRFNNKPVPLGLVADHISER